jgi:hypothetical protein
MMMMVVVVVAAAVTMMSKMVLGIDGDWHYGMDKSLEVTEVRLYIIVTVTT